MLWGNLTLQAGLRFDQQKAQIQGGVTPANAVSPQVIPEIRYDESEELSYSIAEYHERLAHTPVDVPAYFDGDLKELFRQGPMPDEPGALAARDFLHTVRRSLVANIAYWTGLHEGIVRSLVEHFALRCELLGLWLRVEQREPLLMQLTAYATTLCMNKLYKGDFVIK